VLFGVRYLPVTAAIGVTGLAAASRQRISEHPVTLWIASREVFIPDDRRKSHVAAVPQSPFGEQICHARQSQKALFVRSQQTTRIAVPTTITLCSAMCLATRMAMVRIASLCR
jgi:hypothetical protein